MASNHSRCRGRLAGNNKCWYYKICRLKSSITTMSTKLLHEIKEIFSDGTITILSVVIHKHSFTQTHNRTKILRKGIIILKYNCDFSAKNNLQNMTFLVFWSRGSNHFSTKNLQLLPFKYCLLITAPLTNYLPLTVHKPQRPSPQWSQSHAK